MREAPALPVEPNLLPRYPPHSLAPDPKQGELDLRPRRPLIHCRVCGSIHEGPNCQR